VIVSEGRYVDGASIGLTHDECAKIVLGLDCTYGVMLDGGGSSTMYFNGVVLNSAKKNERAVVDFVYFK
jgi:exopolysaccharide biosynthesis protein